MNLLQQLSAEMTDAVNRTRRSLAQITNRHQAGNGAGIILEAFKPYYEQPIVGERSDPQQLYTLQARLAEFDVYRVEEVEQFCAVFFRGKANQSPADHAKMNAILDPAVERFKALRDDVCAVHQRQLAQGEPAHDDRRHGAQRCRGAQRESHPREEQDREARGERCQQHGAHEEAAERDGPARP